MSKIEFGFSFFVKMSENKSNISLNLKLTTLTTVQELLLILIIFPRAFFLNNRTNLAFGSRRTDLDHAVLCYV